MFSGGTPRVALWLAGGTLTVALGAAANHVLDDQFIAVTIGIAFAVAFGATVERMVDALKRGASRTPSFPPTPASADEIRASDQSG
jgi:hypothetical protein